MSLNKEHRVSKKYAKTQFNVIGLMLNVYVLFVLVIPLFLHYYLVQEDSEILKDPYLYFGIYFIIVVFGTVIPFFMMRKYTKIPFKKINGNVNATFFNLFIQALVFFTICIVLTYVSNIIFERIGLEGKMISSIGLSYDNSYLNNVMYMFLFIVVTPIIEEYAFRGVLLNALGKFGKNFALYASAIIFALAHFNLSEFLPAFAMGILLGKTSLRYRSIRPTIIIHVLFNGFIYLMFTLPAYITNYMTYVLAALFVLSIYLFLSGIYERIYIQKLRSNKITNILFFSRPSVILCLILLIFKSIIYMFLE